MPIFLPRPGTLLLLAALCATSGVMRLPDAFVPPAPVTSRALSVNATLQPPAAAPARVVTVDGQPRARLRPRARPETDWPPTTPAKRPPAKDTAPRQGAQLPGWPDWIRPHLPQPVPAPSVMSAGDIARATIAALEATAPTR